MAMSDTDAAKRQKLVQEINGALADIELAQKRRTEAEARLAKAMNDAKAELGTAEAELGRKLLHYGVLRERLDKLLPAFAIAQPG